MMMEQAIIPYRGQSAVLLGMYLYPDRYALRLGRLNHEYPLEWRIYENIDSHAFRNWVLHVPQPIQWSAISSDILPMPVLSNDDRAILSQPESLAASHTWGPKRWTLQDVLMTPLPDGRIVLAALLQMHGEAIGVKEPRAYFDAVVASARQRVSPEE